jgi:transposase InsO family protein
MQKTAENIFNPLRYHLSSEAKKRIRWMYVVHFECGGKITRAANKIGISRPWLSTIHAKWEKSNRDPRSLEPESRAPHNTENRNRISNETEDRIIELRKKYRPWGKDKLSVQLSRDYQLDAGASTVNRYLHKHKLIDPKLSEKNKKAWARKKEQIELKQRIRPPSAIKDYKPGALVEKDMKFILKYGAFVNPAKYKAKENFWYQHTIIDSFTRLRALGIAEDAESKTAVLVQVEAAKRLPFAIATVNTDGGGENEKDFSKHLLSEAIVHFRSRAGIPTDNPRVERSHLTDELEFYAQGNIRRTFEEQKRTIVEWEHTYNYIRPHQALGYLTPMEFFALWKRDPEEAHRIKDRYQAYLRKQSKRLRSSRKMKKKEQIENLMKFIDQKLVKTNLKKC